VVRHGLPPALKNRLKQIFLEAHTDEQGKAILEKMMIEKFVPIDDSAYDSIREMNAWVAAKSSGKKVQ
jgi:phosphonate transport system substrate-binding protein